MGFLSTGRLLTIIFRVCMGLIAYLADLTMQCSIMCQYQEFCILKWKGYESVSCSVVSALCDPLDCIAHQAPLSMGILQARILEWAAMPSSMGSSPPRDQTQVSCMAGRRFTICATREAPRVSPVPTILEIRCKLLSLYQSSLCLGGVCLTASCK